VNPMECTLKDYRACTHKHYSKSAIATLSISS